MSLLTSPGFRAAEELLTDGVPQLAEHHGELSKQALDLSGCGNATIAADRHSMHSIQLSRKISQPDYR